VKPEKYWIIDLESLIISTLTIGLNDKRLLSSSVEWLIKNGDWMNLSRLKRIVKIFSKPLPLSKEHLLSPEIFDLLLETYNKNARNKIIFKKTDLYLPEGNTFNEYKNIFYSFKIRDVVTKPKLQNPALLQLLLRGIFGIDARTEILIYLLVNDNGNSNSIAKEIFYNQKNVYKLLERWANARIVTKISQNKLSSYSLNRKKELLQAMGLKNMLKYLNWARTFLVLDQIAKAIAIPQWSDDEYLLSSFSRELLDDVKLIAKSLNVNVPEPTSFPGKRYFSPFASMALNILKKLNRKA